MAFQPFLSDLSVRRRGTSEPYQGEYVSANYFPMFGIRAFIGRTLTVADVNPGAPPAAVMNYHTWQQHFGLDSAVVGSAFNINGVAYTVVGIAPPGFYGDTLRSDPPDFWLPLGTEPAVNRQTSRLHRAHLEWLYLMGRLKPGTESAQVQARLTVELQQWLNSHAEVIPGGDRKDIARQHVHLTPGGGGVDQMQKEYAAGLRLLMIVAGLVLLIACANVANLLLARGAANRLFTRSEHR